MTRKPQTAQDIESEFPGWHVYRGIDMLWYARSPTNESVRGEDLIDLRDEIIRWIFSDSP